MNEVKYKTLPVCRCAGGAPRGVVPPQKWICRCGKPLADSPLAARFEIAPSASSVALAAIAADKIRRRKTKPAPPAVPNYDRRSFDKILADRAKAEKERT